MRLLLLPLSAVFMTAGLSAQFIINEFLADPPAGDEFGDANGDGARTSGGDEFIEFVNTSGAAVDVENWTVSDSVGVKHTFVGSTIVAEGQSLLIFGGGTPTGAFGGAVVMTSDASLSLNNSGDTITLTDDSEAIVVTYTYGAEGGNKASLNLDPDLTGALFVDHKTLGDGTRAFSPGTKSDGSPFVGDALSVVIDPAHFSEGAGVGAASGTVTRTGDLSATLTVMLESSDISELRVPASVDILAGQASATFAVDAVDDLDWDEAQSATVTASVAGVFSGSFTVMVEDDEVDQPQLVLSVDPGSLSENGGMATVTVDSTANPDGGTYAFEVEVSDASELSGPASFEVTGASSTGTFVVSGVDDADADGSQVVMVTLIDPSGEFQPASLMVTVEDDEVYVFPSVLLNEVRIDEDSTDNNEFFELYSRTAGVSLDRISLVVLGDGPGGSGVVEAVVDLSGESLSGNYFLVGESSMTIAVPDLTTNLNFENRDNVTFLLVGDFTGLNGDDLDTNDDGVLEEKPWSVILDGVGLIEGVNPPISTMSEYEYATVLGLPTVGPFDADGLFFSPPHTYRGVDGIWSVGILDLASDTPGAVNPDGDPPVVAGLEVVGFEVDVESGVGVLTVTGLGTKRWVLQSSDDLYQVDAWEDVRGFVMEADLADGSSIFTFSDGFAATPKRFYRLIEQP